MQGIHALLDVMMFCYDDFLGMSMRSSLTASPCVLLTCLSEGLGSKYLFSDIDVFCRYRTVLDDIHPKQQLEVVHCWCTHDVVQLSCLFCTLKLAYGIFFCSRLIKLLKVTCAGFIYLDLHVFLVVIGYLVLV